MNAEWIKSPTARRVLAHWADARPAWLWSQDGETLLWRNDAARFFHGKIKKHGIKLAPEAVPIRGQIARLIRLGSVGRASLSRIQFLAGERPISTTCTCTPLLLADGNVAMLLVGVDPIEPELLEAQDLTSVDQLATGLFPLGAEFLVVSDDSQIVGGSSYALTRFAPIIESEGLPELSGDSSQVTLAGEPVELTRFTASPQDAMLLLFERAAPAEPAPSIDEVRHDEGITAITEEPDAPSSPGTAEPMLPLGLTEISDAATDTGLAGDANWVEPIPEHDAPPGTLASLFDRLADDNGLYTALSAQDEAFNGPPPELPAEVFTEAQQEIEPEPEAVPEEISQPDVSAVEPTEPEIVAEPAEERVSETAALEPLAEDQAPVEPELVAEAEVPAEPEVAADPDLIGSMITFIDGDEEPTTEPEADAVAEEAAEQPTTQPTTWRIVGRDFTPLASVEPSSVAPESPSDAIETPAPVEIAGAMPPAPDAETVERVSRYNFDELSRILTDRVSGAAGTSEPELAPSAENGSGLVSLSGETFILNRLPLGIMVFRDQQVLFANRALNDLTGYENIEALRAAGLTAIFPAEDAVAGPVTQLVRSDGSLAPVNARLQSINWHGKPALMLSASPAERRESSQEAAVRTFAELAAEMGEDGFFATDRAGILTTVSLHGRILLGEPETELLGRPLSLLIEPGELPELKRFLERPARYAETERPSIMLATIKPDVRLTLFAEGQAGIVTGYFGLVRRVAERPSIATRPQATPPDELETSMLTRVSRSVRRPLNSIIGFADLIRSNAAEPGRQQEYARDIAMAGEEIATLIDEIDDYTQLRDGRYQLQTDEIDLVALLDTCLSRVRIQAAEARVLVRSAVPDQLPRVTADRASLTQAILNLLASAIDQTPAAGTVILSAQREEDGAILINVRDNGERRTDLGERFVVFRDGVGKDGETLLPIRSSVGLALTRSLLAVNALKLNVDPAAGVGTLFSLVVPVELTRP